MKLDELKAQLGASKPWPFYFLKQNSALKGLVQARDPRAVEILADAVDGNHRLAGKIKEALTAITEPAKIDRLCCFWAKKRQPWLGKMITANKWTGQTESVSVLFALKSGHQSVLERDSKTTEAVFRYAADKDEEVRAAVVEYARRLPNDAATNDAIYAILVGTESDELSRIVREQGRLPSVLDEQTAWWILKCGLQSGLGSDPQTTEAVFRYAADNDGEVRAAVVEYARRLPNDAATNDAIYAILVGTESDELSRIVREQGRLPSVLDEQTAWWILKCGLQSGLGSDPQTVGIVFGCVTDKDAEVRGGVLEYTGRLPVDARANDAIYNLWIRTQSPEIEEVICEQQRFPSSVAKETLLRLSLGDVDGYLTLEDENGQIFREAWGIAPDALRQRVTQTVTKSGNSRLIDAYTRALGAREGLDVKTVLEARKTAADEDGLFEASRPLGVLDLLDLCARWAESGKLPSDPARKRAAENAVAAFREVGKIEFEQAPTLPDGLVDFFDAEMEGDVNSPDPFVRLHAAINGKGTPDVKKLAASEHWPDRLAARLLAPELAVSGEKEHVQWTTLAGGVISNSLFATTAEGTPAEHETLLRLRNDGVAVINRGLAGVVLAFQSYFQRGAIASQADDSAEERGSIQEAGAAAEEDLKF